MERKIYIKDNDINMLFAQESDRSLIYDMSVENMDIILSMFEDPSDFKWEEFRDEGGEFFDEIYSINKYLLIEYNGEIVGVFSHTHHKAPVENVEFHIWFISKKYTGKGLGTRVVSLMKDYINKKYSVDTFIMRPWIKNPQAIRTYEKCGFVIQPDFQLSSYFTAEEIATYGNGAYTVEETVNMVAKIV